MTDLKPGDWVSTHYSGKATIHTVVRLIATRGCQSGIMVVVEPVVPKSSGGPLDAAWFYRTIEEKKR